VQKQARITSKGQITVPREVRRVLGVRAGDRLLFESDGKGVRVRPVRSKSAFSKYRGIGNPGIPEKRTFADGSGKCVDNDYRHRHQCLHRIVG
jgi:antitoxin PrlF